MTQTPMEGPMSTDHTPAPETGTPRGRSIEIDAPPARVWELVSEVRNAPRWSTQARKVLATSGPTALGTRSFNINRQGPVFWPTTSRVVDFQPERRFANRTGGHGTQWIFELEPTPSGGTRLTERSEPPAALVAAVRKLTSALPGGRGGPRGSSSSSSTPSSPSSSSGSLRRIKALAEQS
ncbi:SRPBCC family protein [uncultured Dietzia sp.]|uniref:SRPBCC family protein n=1 Tax=uncultured Dietzia sp. TaxID=395519 RepID=UPI0025D2C6BD|nr:SRPBCC family protein [uncultured Dietzia sp.]